MDANRIRNRDAALLRLRRLTAVSLAGAGALALGVAGLAARTFSGHSATHQVRVSRVVAKTAKQTPPPLVAAASSAPTPQSAQPAPTPTPAPPVVVSGGS